MVMSFTVPASQIHTLSSTHDGSFLSSVITVDRLLSRNYERSTVDVTKHRRPHLDGTQCRQLAREQGKLSESSEVIKCMKSDQMKNKTLKWCLHTTSACTNCLLLIFSHSECCNDNGRHSRVTAKQ